MRSGSPDPCAIPAADRNCSSSGWVAKWLIPRTDPRAAGARSATGSAAAWPPDAPRGPTPRAASVPPPSWAAVRGRACGPIRPPRIPRKAGRDPSCRTPAKSESSPVRHATRPGSPGQQVLERVQVEGTGIPAFGIDQHREALPVRGAFREPILLVRVLQQCRVDRPTDAGKRTRLPRHHKRRAVLLVSYVADRSCPRVRLLVADSSVHYAGQERLLIRSMPPDPQQMPAGGIRAPRSPVRMKPTRRTSQALSAVPAA